MKDQNGEQSGEQSTENHLPNNKEPQQERLATDQRPKIKHQLTGGGGIDEEEEEKEGAEHGRPIDERRMRMNEGFNLEEFISKIK